MAKAPVRHARYLIYGYEPGLLRGTPMTQEVKPRTDAPPHRMPGVPAGGIDPARLAQLIGHNIAQGGYELNGTMIRLDGGEQ
jgi:hypothetical protein